MTTNRFPRTARVRARSEFDRVFKHGRRVALPVLALHVHPADHSARLGLAISRKVDPRAVGRNRIKRILRDTFRQLRPRLPDGDYVVVGRIGAARLTPDELRRMFVQLLARAGAVDASVAIASPRSLPDSETAGTMPPAPPSSPAERVSRAG